MATSPSIETIRRAVLDLQPAARAELAHTLVQSLASLPEKEIAELWLAEAARRNAEMETGKVAGIPSDLVFQRLRERYVK